MSQGSEPARDLPVLILDPDESRGRLLAEAVRACGFTSFSADRYASALDQALGRRIGILVLEQGAVSREAGGTGDGASALDEGQVRRLQEALGSPYAVLWNGGSEGPAAAPSWCGAAAEGTAALVGLVALRSASMGAEPIEEMERMHIAVEEARAAAHDMSQPLTTILARAQLLLAKLEETDPSHRPVAIISQEAERLARTVQRFQVLRQFRSRSS